MKLSMKWLNEYVHVPDDLKAFCDFLDMTGTGVEGVEETGATFDKVVVGQIAKKEQHPDSDHMWVCQAAANRLWRAELQRGRQDSGRHGGRGVRRLQD